MRTPIPRCPTARAALCPYSICWRTLARQLWSSSVPGYPRSSSCGIRYSNIVPPHDISVAPAADIGDQASEVEPVMLGDVAFGDRDEARQPRF